MTNKLPRRQMLKTVAVSVPFVLISRTDAMEVDILEKTVISRQPANYHGWPTIARRANGQLLVSCTGGRESHVCPFGRVELFREFLLRNSSY